MATFNYIKETNGINIGGIIIDNFFDIYNGSKLRTFLKEIVTGTVPGINAGDLGDHRIHIYLDAPMVIRLWDSKIDMERTYELTSDDVSNLTEVIAIGLCNKYQVIVHLT